MLDDDDVEDDVDDVLVDDVLDDLQINVKNFLVIFLILTANTKVVVSV